MKKFSKILALLLALVMVFSMAVTAAAEETEGEAEEETVEEEAVPSAMGGFKWDSSAFTDQLAEISAIKDSYYKNFCSSTTPIDDVKDEFLEKMNAAGLQEMIADAQAQLDAYLAAN